MSVLKKGRRKIVCGDTTYIWYIKPDDESPYNILNVVSEDKSLIISCPLETETSYIISKGHIFQNKKTDGKWNRYLLPFNVPPIITPKFVSELILWATQGVDAVNVKFNGIDIDV